MAGSTIGIKIADGSYYPILDEGFRGTKRLVLTTVKDNQDRVQIDLYRGDGHSLARARYIGSLVIENIAPLPQGQPEIELVLDLDQQGELTAEAVDRSTGEAQSFAMNLGGLAEGEGDELPELGELEDTGWLASEEAPEETLEPLEQSSSDLGAVVVEKAASPIAPEEEGEEVGFEEEPLTGEAYPVSEADRRREHLRHPAAGGERRRGLSPALTVLLVVLGLLLVLAIAWLVLSAIKGPSFLPFLYTQAPAGKEQPLGRATAPPAGSQAAAASAPAASATAAPTTGTPAPTASATGAATTPAPTTKQATAPKATQATGAATTKTSATKSKGVSYRIKRGDTLWDIAATYYRNPWLYPRIAKLNKITNPDFILAGTRIFIPEE